MCVLVRLPCFKLKPPPDPFLLSSTELITDNQIEIGQLKAELKDKVMYTLLRKHRHQTKKSNLRSLADIGKTVSSASRLFSNQENGNTDASVVQSLLPIETVHLQWSEEEEEKTGKTSPGAQTGGLSGDVDPL